MTNPAFKLLAPKNNATVPTLLGAIAAGDTTIVLGSGHGAYLPTILRGDCSSTGDARTLNDTGALASVAVGDYIYNLTDGSWAVVITGGTNSIRTTPLEGGSLNVWTSGDIWVVGMFVATITQFSGSTIVKQERVLVTNRVSDTLTVVRGHDSDTALAFLAGDSVQILWEESQVEGIHNALRNILGKIDALHRGVPFTVATGGTSTAYTATLTPKVTSLADIAGLPITLQIHTACGASPTLALNGLTAKNIKKEGGATALASGDMAINMPAVVIYNVALDCFVLVNAVANAPASSSITIDSKTADYTIGAAESAKVFSNSGATTGFAFTLPSAVAGLVEDFLPQGGQGFSIAAASGDNIQMDGQTLSGIQGRTPYDYLSLIAVDATVWAVKIKRGNGWTMGNIGYFAGGWNEGGTEYSIIDNMNFITETSAAIAATLSGTAVEAAAGCSTPINGYLLGGTTDNDSTGVTGIQKLTMYGTEVMTVLTATLDQGRAQGAGGMSRTKGYVVGGIASTKKTTISALVFADESEANIAAVMATATAYFTAGQSSLKQYNLSGTEAADVATIKNLTFATEAIANNANSFSAADAKVGAISSALAIYQMSGATATTTIRKLTISGETTSNLAATLDSNHRGPICVSGLAKGYCAGGNATSTAIDDLNYSSEASVAIAATLDTGRMQGTGLFPWSI